MKIPFLHNVRRGLATNSSSSHSLVFHSEPVQRGGDTIPAGGGYVDTEFGWDHFILRDLYSKLMYGLTQAVGQHWWGKDEDGEEMKEAVAEARAQWGEMFPEITSDEDWARAISGYVDHDSKVSVTREFVDKLRDPRVVVHGGNDNDGYPQIDYSYDEATGKYTERDIDLPAGATREMLG
jgi:hypothetical protein